MIDAIKKAFAEIEKLHEKKQQELAQLIHDELSWENTFLQNQDLLSQMANEALNEYKTGKISDKEW
ncbi:MAG: hypothetical protein ABJC12_02735 [Saprospiraceae bacterium]